MSGPIKHHCPLCKKKRRDPSREPPTDVGGEDHRIDRYWFWTPFGRFCGWCAERLERGEKVAR